MADAQNSQCRIQLAEATGAIEFDLKLKLKDFGTRLEHENLV
jgi:hypothetical protein